MLREDSARHCKTRWFVCGGVVQLVRTPACHAGGRGFESRRSRQHYKTCTFPSSNSRSHDLPQLTLGLSGLRRERTDPPEPRSGWMQDTTLSSPPERREKNSFLTSLLIGLIEALEGFESASRAAIAFFRQHLCV